MPHETTLIATIAAAFVLAFAFGFSPRGAAAAARRLPARRRGDRSVHAGLRRRRRRSRSQLAEIGVILLMFGVGLHFSIRDLLAVRGIAVPGALGQIAGRDAASAPCLRASGAGRCRPGWCSAWRCRSRARSCCCARSSDRRKLDSAEGRIAVGWLIVEDLAMVLALVLLPALAQTLGGEPARRGRCDGVGQQRWLALGADARQGRVFVALVLVVGTPRRAVAARRRSRAPARASCSRSRCWRWRSASPSARPRCSACRSRSAPSSPAWSSASPSSATGPREDSLPLQDAFAVLFFVSVGMLFDPSILVREPLAVLGVVLVIVVGKSLAAFVIVLLFRLSASAPR